MRKIVAGLVWLTVAACGQEPKFYAPDSYPQRLSAWGIIDAELNPASSSMQYALNTALFSDYTLKLRTLYLPPGEQARFSSFDAFDFPTGTIVSKTFYYTTNESGDIEIGEHSTPLVGAAEKRKKIIETRLLVKQSNGWDALPYVWQGDDAYLAITGKIIQLKASDQTSINYLVPSKNQCASCHATNHSSGAIQPIGLKARHLHRPIEGGSRNQLEVMAERSWLAGLPALETIEPNARLADSGAALEHRARSYLDVNCGHCHNPEGPADTSGLLLDYQPHSLRALGQCKPPIAAGRGSGGYNFSIVPGQANKSILAFRMASRDPAVMMPELGRTLVHAEGLRLIEDWINQLSGECL